MDLNLDTLKREILEYLESSGLAVFHGHPGGLDSHGMVLWDVERRPDYQTFLEVAAKCEARLIVFAAREFGSSDVDDLLNQLEGLDIDRDEKRDFEKRLRAMRRYEGVTCSLELAFDYHSRLYVYQMQPDWYDEFLSVEDEIVSLLSDAEDADDDEPLGGYFSKN
ncbi:MAG TPA: hypothetical protein VMB03_11810 [Bryobacteraceae bacterium]|nr:hypothetical protein [Bryobacteraceae bacterium]